SSCGRWEFSHSSADKPEDKSMTTTEEDIYLGQPSEGDIGSQQPSDDEIEEPLMTTYDPNSSGTTLYWSSPGYSRRLVNDEWNQEAYIFDRSFDLLTPTGKDIFIASSDYVKSQKKAEFSDYAQPLKCTENVSVVLNSIGYSFQGISASSIPHFIEVVQISGGKVYDIPKYNHLNGKNKIIQYFQEHFPNSIPTGAIIVGCLASNCKNSALEGGHMAILGDKNEFGELMIYHNNWLRPDLYDGLRMPYMVSLENMYVFLRIREWMATPWLHITRNAGGKIQDITSVMPLIKDFDLFNGQYHVKVVLTREVYQEMLQRQFLPVHKNIATGNQHRGHHALEDRWEVCRSLYPLQKMDPRITPDGLPNFEVVQELEGLRPYQTFLDSRFEFAVMEEQDGWVSALIFDSGRFWGSNDVYGSLWVRKDMVECWHNHTPFYEFGDEENS
ncbi:MAG: hypothetical protein OXC40_02685, partial [Proteobacteria bacterium]|nr:hypothetical protein [Pseudomonadota bacterium]